MTGRRPPEPAATGSPTSAIPGTTQGLLAVPVRAHRRPDQAPGPGLGRRQPPHLRERPSLTWLEGRPKNSSFAALSGTSEPDLSTDTTRSPLRQPGRVVDITARIEHRRVMGGLISEYRRAA
jgi:hypothetical protein